MIEIAGLTKTLTAGARPVEILHGIDLRIGAGEFVAIVGPSGSGKSTLLGLIAGLDRPTGGSIKLAGEEITGLGEDALARLRGRTLGFVFQSFQLIPTLTAEENVAVPLELRGAGEARARARALLASVGLEGRGHHLPGQLSGGEQQRVALARAFVGEPPILLADEPTGNLDSATGERVLALLDDLRARAGTTVVLVTHDPGLAARADRVIALRDGRVDSDRRRAA
jgi:putative ABC transport system ATP-binding protein